MVCAPSKHGMTRVFACFLIFVLLLGGQRRVKIAELVTLCGIEFHELP